VKVYNKVRGTMVTVPNIEVNKDTVYIRSNITQVEMGEFLGWEYDEIQYDSREYLENLTTLQDTQSMAMLLSLLMSEIDYLGSRVTTLEGKVI
jgi:hypothetical protein